MIVTIDTINRGPDRWHVVYDCKLKQEIIFRIIPHVFPADNPQQSEHCSHIGGQGNKSCRSCKIGGTVEERESEEGYDTFFSVSLATILTQCFV